jgi:hypothetical protein
MLWEYVMDMMTISCCDTFLAQVHFHVVLLVPSILLESDSFAEFLEPVGE